MKPCHHIDYTENCRICWLSVNDIRYQKLWNLPIKTEQPKKLYKHKKKLCLYRDEEKLPNYAAAKLSLDVRRTWYVCSHPDKPLGEYVCPCKGCGVRCTGYTIKE